MVPLEDRSYYSLTIDKSPKLMAFNNLLLDKPIARQKAELNESEEIYFGILNSIHTNNKTEFENYYSKKSKSNPNKESSPPFVNDDFLIFSLIVGIIKFGLDKKWIKNILHIRNRNPITITLENILNGNYYSKSNLYEVVLTYSDLIDSSLINNDLLNNAYKNILAYADLFNKKSDFQILCALRAYDLIILLKESPNGSEINLLKLFNFKFRKRIKVFSWILQVFFLFSFIYFLFKLPVYSSQTIEFLDKYGYIFTVLGALGFTFLGNQFDFISKNCQELIMRLFGYPKGLIKKKEESKD